MKLRPSNLWISIWITDLKKNKIFKENDLMFLAQTTTWDFRLVVLVDSKFSHYVKSGNYVGKTSSL